ncbi:MAG: hypothetical protein OXG62_06385 [Nitrospinae bacterium]|nr:hypothetical protein [Nitrospinota bacterium]
MKDDTRTGRDVSGENTYVFFEGHGDDKITGFDAGGDAIDFTRFGATITFEQLHGKFSATTGGTVIDLSEFGGAGITLKGVVPADLTEELLRLPGGVSSVAEPVEPGPLTTDKDVGIGAPFGVTHHTGGGDDSMEPQIRKAEWRPGFVIALYIHTPFSGFCIPSLIGIVEKVHRKSALNFTPPLRVGYLLLGMPDDEVRAQARKRVGGGSFFCGMSPHRIGLRPRARPLRRAFPSGSPTLKGGVVSKCASRLRNPFPVFGVLFQQPLLSRV